MIQQYRTNFHSQNQPAQAIGTSFESLKSLTSGLQPFIAISLLACSRLSDSREWQRAKESGEEGQTSEPALIDLCNFFEVKYHWSKSGKGEKNVSL